MSTNKNIPAREGDHLASRRPGVQTIEVEGLFGHYDFPPLNISLQEREHPNLAFLYGENGVGKTTILRLLYSLLSPETNAGHRGILARAKFRQFGVTFTDGQKVLARREAESVSGDYAYEFSGPRYNAKIPVMVGPDGRVSREGIGDGEAMLLKMLDDVSPTMVFVNDHRTIRSTYEAWDVRSYLNSRFKNSPHYSGGIIYDATSSPVQADVDSIASVGLSRLLTQTRNLFVERAILGNTLANVGTGQIYVTIARTIAHSAVNASRNDEQGSFKTRVASIERFLKQFGQFEIVQGESIQEVERIFAEAPKHAKSQLLEVLEPYLASIEKRIDSNRALAEQMAAFENGVNAFLRRKKMICRLRDPIKFIEEGGGEIEQSDLSSGERHLLYLFCASVLSRERQTIIIVDEPELSLNYKWQRLLVGSLLSVAGNEAQFIMATHSFEIISKFRDSAVSVEPRH